MERLPEDERWEFTGRDKLEAILMRADINRDDICLVGDLSLSVRELRQHEDVDFCVLPELHEAVPEDDLTGSIRLVKNRYENIDLTDEDLITNPRYHDTVDGFKVVRPEIVFSYKRLQDSEKDNRDVELLENFSLVADDWNWDLYRSNYGERPSSLLSRGIQSLHSDGVLITLDKVAGLAFRKYPVLRRIDNKIPFYDVKTPIQAVTDSTRTVTIAELLNRQYVGETFASMDTVAYWAMIDDGSLFDVRSLSKDPETVRSKPLSNLEPVPVSQKHRILDPAAVARLIHGGKDEVKIRFSFKRHTPRDDQWVRSQFDEPTAELLDKQRVEMLESVGGIFYAIFWPPTCERFDEMEQVLAEKVRIRDSYDVRIDDMESFVKDIYEAQAHPAPTWSIDWKAQMMADFPDIVRIVRIELPEPRIRDGISREMEMIKNDVRHAFMNDFPDEYYVCLLHSTDSFSDNLATKSVVEEHAQSVLSKENKRL